ncbi:DNA polymerase IV [Knoellia sp. DB2414S]|uniref:DNA polymerase IV n=1 Tax=Knoellia koreensis TaxID=2730921 RepID=A0A849HNX1_9MICO|nr:DNA polymerase IV [Knoellia sp. DB2414S]
MPERVLLHADADAFFASVEERDDPSLRGTPFVVGDPVVACASYPARALGIHAGMPLGRVRARWPDVRVVGFREGVHEQASEALFGLFRELTPLVEPGSMEEAFLDVSAVAGDAPTAGGVAARLRARCRTDVGLPVSVGVGRTKLMAKLASRRAKPDGLHVIAPADEPGVRNALRLEEIWGVGPRTQARLREAGLADLVAVRSVSREGLEDILGRTMGRLLHDIAHGRESSTVVLPKPRLSVNRTRTISPPSRSRSRVEAVLADCIERACGVLADDPRVPTRVDLVLRYDDGVELLVHRPLDLPGPAPTPATITGELAPMLAATAYEEDGRGVALVGVTAHLPRARE